MSKSKEAVEESILIVATYRHGGPCFVAVKITVPEDEDILAEADKVLSEAGYETKELGAVEFHGDFIPSFLQNALDNDNIPLIDGTRP